VFTEGEVHKVSGILKQPHQNCTLWWSLELLYRLN